MVKCEGCGREVDEVILTRRYTYDNSWIAGKLHEAICAYCDCDINFDPLETHPEE